jgi:tRNA dimethylallyltransferase
MLCNLITLLGVTATGKTGLAVKLAAEFNGEIISADSRQVYRRMNIGTGKDLNDYNLNGVKVQYHLIDIVEPEEEFNLFEFRRRFWEAFNSIINRKKLPILVGGTGLYLSSILQNYELKEADFSSMRAAELKELNAVELKDLLLSKESAVHNTTDLLDKDRLVKAILIAEAKYNPVQKVPEIHSLVLGLKMEREEIKKRITARLKKRLDEGMIEEAKDLIESGLSFEKLNFFGLEYRYLGLYLKGEMNIDEMFSKLNTAIHDFAKRQMTWFRKMEREGIKIHWIEEPYFSNAKEVIKKELNGSYSRYC